MKRNITLYLKDIIEAMDAIENFVKDIDFEKFRTDDKTSKKTFIPKLKPKLQNILKELEKKNAIKPKKMNLQSHLDKGDCKFYSTLR